MKSALAGTGLVGARSRRARHGQRAPAARARDRSAAARRDRDRRRRRRAPRPLRRRGADRASSLAAHPGQGRRGDGQDDAELARFVPRPQGHERSAPQPIEPASAPIRAKRGCAPRARCSRGFERLARETPLLIAVARLHRADDSSATLLAALAQRVGLAPHAARAGLRSRRASHGAGRAREPARAGDTDAAARPDDRRGARAGRPRRSATFRNTERLVSWLHELTSGKPQACLDLLQHLIEQEVIRFHDGVWLLPHELCRRRPAARPRTGARRAPRSAPAPTRNGSRSRSACTAGRSRSSAASRSRSSSACPRRSAR